MIYETMERIGDRASKHLYEIGVSKDDTISVIQVDADSRSTAVKLAQAAGYMIRDVNLVG